jgi:hypothetical protein
MFNVRLGKTVQITPVPRVVAVVAVRTFSAKRLSDKLSPFASVLPDKLRCFSQRLLGLRPSTRTVVVTRRLGVVVSYRVPLNDTAESSKSASNKLRL